MTIRRAECYCVVDKQFLPVMDVEVSLGSNGSLSTVSGTSSIVMLREKGVDLFSAAQTEEGASIDVYMGFSDNAEKVFSGVLDDFDLDFDSDRISFSGRDHAAALIDTKEVSSSINYKNQTIGQIVKQIAQKANLTPKVTDPGIPAGPELWDQSAYMPHGQQWWSMLQDLARSCGYECHVTNDKELFFGPTEDAGGDQIKVSYFKKGAEIPVKGLKITYQPRRNANVEVKVIGFHPIRRQSIKSTAKALAHKGKGGGGKGSFLVGRSSKGKQTAKSGGSKPSAKPTVIKRMDGITKEQADQIAESMAKDIAKRQLILHCTTEGLPKAKVHSKLSLSTAVDLFGLENADWVISTVNHRYSSEGGDGGGFVTEITALTKPEIEKS